MYRKKIIDDDVRECLDRRKEWFPLDCLDSVPKKSVSEQVFDLVYNRQALEETKLQALNVPIGDDEDIDNIQDIDEYADRFDVERMTDYLIRKRHQKKDDNNNNNDNDNKNNEPETPKTNPEPGEKDGKGK